MAEATAQLQHMQVRTSSALTTMARRRRRCMSMRALWLAAAAFAVVLPVSTIPGVAAQTPTTISPDSAPAGQFMLQCHSNTTAGAATNVLAIMHKTDDAAAMSSIVDIETVAAASPWTIGAWDVSFAALEEKLKAVAPTLTRLDLAVQFQQPLAVQSLAFERSTAQWSFGPALVFAENALQGLASLQNLSFVRFNVTFEAKSWLPAAASLKQLVFDQCTVPLFTIDTAAVITEAVFRGSNLTSFPTFLLDLNTPLTTLTLENNQITRPITMSSKDLEQLHLIKTVSFTNNSIATTMAVATCNRIETYKNMTICVSDLTFRGINKSLLDSGGSAPEADTHPPVTSSSATSSKLMSSVIVILSICGIAVLVIGSLVYRRQRRSPTRSGNTRANCYANSDALLSPSKLEPVAPTTSSAVAATTPTKDEPPALLTQTSSSVTAAAVVSDLDLGREVIHLGKKLGVHGLRKGAYRDAPVVALRLSLRSLHISMREANRIVASFVPLRHRNVIALIGTSMTALEDLLIVVEYMAKGSLRSVLRTAKIELPWPDRIRMARDVCSALTFLHSVRPGLVSKHLTAKSVLVSSDLVCKLDIFDYGRKVRDHAVPIRTFGQCEIASRAPEVLTGGDVTREAEVYALGVLLCELSLRQLPFEAILTDRGATLGDLFIAREVVAQRLVLAPADDAPRAFQDIATQCLAFDPAARPSVEDVAQALQALG